MNDGLGFSMIHTSRFTILCWLFFRLDIDGKLLRKAVDEWDLEVLTVEAHDDGVDDDTDLQRGVDDGNRRRKNLDEVEEVDEDREHQRLFPMELRKFAVAEQNEREDTQETDISYGYQECLTTRYLVF